MKKLVTRLFAIVLFGSVAGFGQTPADSLLSFFPLQPGNRWQYKVFIEIDPFNRDTTYETFEVAGDTLMPNGRHYAILEHHWSRYFRVDSTTFQVRSYFPYGNLCADSERIMFDLTVQDTGHYLDCAGGPVLYETGIKPIGLLPDSAESLQFMWFDGITSIYVLSRGIGISFWEQSELSYARAYLIAAIVDSVQYGQFIVGIEPTQGTAEAFELYQNYPNPFNPSTQVRFRISRGDRSDLGVVKLIVYNSLGEEIKTLISKRMSAGIYTYTWDGTNNDGEPVSSGVYFYRLRVGRHSAVRKMLLLR